ncbi:MAG: hypothetical protein, partial [Olavius algarvensis Gamma 1 endosymbiont]
NQMNVIVQADHIIPEEMAKIQNQVESRTVKTEIDLFPLITL